MWELKTVTQAEIHLFLSAGQQSPSHTVMDQLDGLTVAETLRQLSALLGCSPTCAEVAAYLDQHDELRHLREQFLLPKIAHLPPCESRKDSTVYHLGFTLV